MIMQIIMVSILTKQISKFQIGVQQFGFGLNINRQAYLLCCVNSIGKEKEDEAILAKYGYLQDDAEKMVVETVTPAQCSTSIHSSAMITDYPPYKIGHMVKQSCFMIWLLQINFQQNTVWTCLENMMSKSVREITRTARKFSRARLTVIS